MKSQKLRVASSETEKRCCTIRGGNSSGISISATFSSISEICVPRSSPIRSCRSEIACSRCSIRRPRSCCASWAFVCICSSCIIRICRCLIASVSIVAADCERASANSERSVLIRVSFNSSYISKESSRVFSFIFSYFRLVIRFCGSVPPCGACAPSKLRPSPRPPC